MQRTASFADLDPTSRPRRVSRAQWTMPIPPAPRRVAIVRQRRAPLQWVRCIGLKGSRGAMHLKRRLVSTFTLAAFVTLLPSLPTTQASKAAFDARRRRLEHQDRQLRTGKCELLPG